MTTKTAMITIAGRPNVGKSTLTNKLTGEKIAIVTPKPQTTRNRIYGVFDYGDAQMILLDTPGYHNPRNRLGEYMVGIARESVADVDAVALIVEPVDNVGAQEDLLIGDVARSGVPCILVINKIDTIKVDLVLPIMETYSRRFGFDAIIPISAKTGDGLPQLLEALAAYAKTGPRLFPDGMATDQPEKQIIAEIIREKLLMYLDKEVPHGIAVEIMRFEQRGGQGGDDSEEGCIIDVEAAIYCEKNSHKGIIIGKNGVMLKRVGREAREDMERFMGAKIYLQTWVKVRENWRDSKTMLKNFGYVK